MATKYKSVGPEAAARIFDSGAHMVDVRQQHEWDAGHVEGADRVPASAVGTSSVGRADTLVVVSRTGTRSKSAAKKLVKAGYVVYHLEGGLKAWEAAGLPLVSRNGSRAHIV